MKNELFFEEMIFEEAKICDNLSKLGGKVTNFTGFNKVELNIDKLYSATYNKREGSYYSFNVTGNFNRKTLIIEVSNAIRKLVKNSASKVKNLLIVGLGNRFVTADSLGENTLSKIKIDSINCQKLTPSVKSVTNIESVSLVKAVVKHLSPDLVIIIDSLSTRDFAKLCSSIQLTDSGIIAGGGAYKSDKLFDKSTLNVPVIAIGVPLIINLSKVFDSKKGLLCPHQIDLFVNEIGDILSSSIMEAFNKK